MGRRSRLASGLVVTFMLVLVGLAGFASASSTSVAAAPATFTDPAGDANGAADITTIAFSTDPATGMVELSVTATGLLAIDPAKEPLVGVYLDIDKNPATGSASGSEYWAYYWTSPGHWGWDMERWNAAAATPSWEEIPQSATLSFRRSGDTLTWLFSKADIGGSSGFGFHAASGISDTNGDIVALDQAPDFGNWTYDLAPVVVKPVFVRAMMSFPLAGKRTTFTMEVKRSDTGAPLKTGKLVCDPSVAGKVLPHSEQFKNGVVSLAFVIPKTAKGKLLKVKVTITVNGNSATKVVSFKVF